MADEPSEHPRKSANAHLQQWVLDTVAKNQNILLDVKIKPARRCSQESCIVYLCQVNHEDFNSCDLGL